MSCADPTPSPSANAASLITWQTIRPSTRPGASPTQVVCLPRVEKKRSAAVTAEDALSGPRGGRGAVVVGSARVVVEALARLSSGAPGGDGLDADGRRTPARLAEALLEERPRDVEPRIDPDQVHQLKRPHPEASLQTADPID